MRLYIIYSQWGLDEGRCGSPCINVCDASAHMLMRHVRGDLADKRLLAPHCGPGAAAGFCLIHTAACASISPYRVSHDVVRQHRAAACTRAPDIGSPSAAWALISVLQSRHRGQVHARCSPADPDHLARPTLHKGDKGGPQGDTPGHILGTAVVRVFRTSDWGPLSHLRDHVAGSRAAALWSRTYHKPATAASVARCSSCPVQRPSDMR